MPASSLWGRGVSSAPCVALGLLQAMAQLCLSAFQVAEREKDPQPGRSLRGKEAFPYLAWDRQPCSRWEGTATRPPA